MNIQPLYLDNSTKYMGKDAADWPDGWYKNTLITFYIHKRNGICYGWGGLYEDRYAQKWAIDLKDPYIKLAGVMLT